MTMSTVSDGTDVRQESETGQVCELPTTLCFWEEAFMLQPAQWDNEHRVLLQAGRASYFILGKSSQPTLCPGVVENGPAQGFVGNNSRFITTQR